MLYFFCFILSPPVIHIQGTIYFISPCIPSLEISALRTVQSGGRSPSNSTMRFLLLPVFCYAPLAADNKLKHFFLIFFLAFLLLPKRTYFCIRASPISQAKKIALPGSVQLNPDKSDRFIAKSPCLYYPNASGNCGNVTHKNNAQFFSQISCTGRLQISSVPIVE